MNSATSGFDTPQSSASCDLSLNSERLIEICDEFQERLQAGEDVSVAEYTSLYPDIEKQIEASLNALQRFLNNAIPAKQPATPAEIAGCRVLRQIGAGATGTVYEALHPQLSRRLAIKVLSSTVGVNHSSERFLQEAEVCSRLAHPNIVPFVDYGVDGDRTYLSMHYVDGQSLDSILDSSYSLRNKFKSLDGLQEADPLDATVGFETLVIAHDYQKIAAIGADIAGALDYAHRMKVIHRDIKPGNLLLDRQGKIWVADFGLAKAQITEANMVVSTGMVGTPRYMAPEQIRGICSHQSDIYSLGVTLYELASGQRAWESTSRAELLKARTGLELPSLSEIAPHVPEGLAKIIMKACALKPVDRYPTAAELANVLARFAESGQVGDRRNPKRQEGQKYLRRKPIWLATGVCSVAAAFGWFVWSGPQRLPPEPRTVMEALQNGDILEHIVGSLPDAEHGDTAEARKIRQELAGTLEGFVDKFMGAELLSPRDRESNQRLAKMFTDKYVSGGYTKQDVTRTSKGSGKRELTVATRMKSTQRQLLKSDLTYEEKGRLVVLFQKLILQCESGTVLPAVADELDKLLPKIGERVSPDDVPRVKAIFTKIQQLVGEDGQ